MVHMSQMWEIVCSDGRVRHPPYNNPEDAAFDADLCDERACRLYPTPGPLEQAAPPCPGAPHRIRQVDGRTAPRDFPS